MTNFSKENQPEPRDPAVHLYRGAPAVRGWSIHQQTVETWTLCGVRWQKRREPLRATENAGEVTCQYCLQLMKESRRYPPVAVPTGKGGEGK